MQILGLQHWVNPVDYAVNPKRRADRVAALVVIGELDLRSPFWQLNVKPNDAWPVNAGA